MLEKYPWIIKINSEIDKRFGIKVRHIKSGNDGDICNSIVTHTLLNIDRPVYCLDIGVDEGWWSFFVADINPNAIIHAFEPNPISYKAVLAYLENTPQIHLHNLAISDKEGTLSFICDAAQSNSRNDCLNKDPIDVQCILPAEYVKDRFVDLIKIDTEGHDLIILKALHPYLKNINSIIFECSVYWYGKTMEECIETTVDELSFLRGHYKYMYILSRRDEPILYTLEHKDILQFIVFSYNYHQQCDILLSQTEITTIKTGIFFYYCMDILGCF